MSNPNPFVPKGSLIEQQSKRRSNLKIGVSCVLAVSIVGLLAMLIQGCKRDTSGDNSQAPSDQDTNAVVQTDTNTPPITDTNIPVVTAPISTNPVPPVEPAQPPVTLPPVTQPETAPVADNSGSEYVVVSGDTLAKIAKKSGVTLKALEAANPDVNPKRLKVKQKLVIPAGGTVPALATGGVSDGSGVASADEGTTTTYTVKSGDTLHKIAKRFHISVKAIEAANNLSTTKIKVAEKLKIPSKVDTSAPAIAPAPPEPAAPAALPTLPAPAPAPAPAAAPGSPGAT
jgi:LysM repeat protein